MTAHRTTSSFASPRSDHAAVAAVARGDLSALGELYDRYHRDVRRVLTRIGVSEADTDDLIQATFLELPKIAANYTPQAEQCRGWICGIAVRLASRHRRSAVRYLRAILSMGHVRVAIDDATPERNAKARDELRVFDRAFRALGAKKREAFVLLELEGLSAELCGATLGVPPVTMRTRLHQARLELREAMAAWDRAVEGRGSS